MSLGSLSFSKLPLNTSGGNRGSRRPQVFQELIRSAAETAGTLHIWGFKTSLPLYFNKPLWLSVFSHTCGQLVAIVQSAGFGTPATTGEREIFIPIRRPAAAIPTSETEKQQPMKLSTRACAQQSDLSSTQRWRTPHAMVCTVTLNGHSRCPRHSLHVSCQRLKACFFPKYPSRTFTS